MRKNTGIGTNGHSPCVESTFPHRILPQDISYEEEIRDRPKDDPGEKVPLE